MRRRRGEKFDGGVTGQSKTWTPWKFDAVSRQNASLLAASASYSRHAQHRAVSLRQVITVLFYKNIVFFLIVCINIYYTFTSLAHDPLALGMVVEPEGQVITFVVNLLSTIAEIASQSISRKAYRVAQKE